MLKQKNAKENIPSLCDYVIKESYVHLKGENNSYEDILSVFNIAIYPKYLESWFKSYLKIVKKDNINIEDRSKKMLKINPKYIIKNYMLQDAIDAVKEGDYTLTNDLLNIAQNPFDEHEKYESYSRVTPLKYTNIKLSCSS